MNACIVCGTTSEPLRPVYVGSMAKTTGWICEVAVLCIKRRPELSSTP